jgi:hypothetical protein
MSSWTLCKTCFEAAEAVVDACEGEGEECSLCETKQAESWHEVTSVQIPQELIEEVNERIIACEMHGCGAHWDSEGDCLWDETNMSLRDCISEVLEGLDPHLPETRFLEAINYAGDHELIELDGFQCSKCREAITALYTDIKVPSVNPLILRLANPPAEISDLKPTTPGHAIEYSRSDCSTYLVHLTRGARLAVEYDNVGYNVTEAHLTAPEVLWNILSTRKLLARQGKGMSSKAVCFTEKPMGALKDTLIGPEAKIRQQSSLTWKPYGVMFEKDYLRSLGVMPVIYVSAAERRTIPDDLQYRCVTLGKEANWVHEREWRIGKDLEFDISQCVVLVPTFDQVEAFQSVLTKRGLKPKGFLPILDVFAAL